MSDRPLVIVANGTWQDVSIHKPDSVDVAFIDWNVVNNHEGHYTQEDIDAHIRAFVADIHGRDADNPFVGDFLMQIQEYADDHPVEEEEGA